MEQHKEIPNQLSVKQKLHILFGTLAGLGVGGVSGFIAYYQHWLG